MKIRLQVLKINLFEIQKMNLSLASCNHFKIKNGKLVPHDVVSEPTTNYRYIPYHPLNKPTDQDYFRVTIDELVNQKAELLKLLSQKDMELQSKLKGNYRNFNGAQEIRCRQQLREIKRKFANTETEIQRQQQLIKIKDQQLDDTKNENINLKNTITSLGKELDSLKSKLKRSQFEASKIKNVLESFNKTIEQVSRLEDAISNHSETSEHLSRSSIENKRQSTAYRTPKQKIHEFQPQYSAQETTRTHRLRSEGTAYRTYRSAKGQLTPQTLKTDSVENRSNEDSAIQYKQTWNGKNNYLTVPEDPIAGTFSSLFSRNRK